MEEVVTLTAGNLTGVTPEHRANFPLLQAGQHLTVPAGDPEQRLRHHQQAAHGQLQQEVALQRVAGHRGAGEGLRHPGEGQQESPGPGGARGDEHPHQHQPPPQVPGEGEGEVLLQLLSQPAWGASAGGISQLKHQAEHFESQQS